MAAWFEQFFDGLYSRVLPKTYDDAATLEQARMVKRLLRVRKGHRVLDIPCGMGRLTIPLAQRGLDMTGVDLTAAYLKRAGRQARRDGLRIRWVHNDMRDIAFRGEFDGAFNWFGSFGYFSDEENLAFCSRVFDALKPGGRFLVEGMNKPWLLSHFRHVEDHAVGGVRVTTRNRWDARTNRVHGTWLFGRGNARERHAITMRLFNGTEMRALLHEAGFRDIQLFPRPPVGPFTRHSRRLIAVAQKPAEKRAGMANA